MMTVEELIKKLEKCNPKDAVEITVELGCDCINKTTGFIQVADYKEGIISIEEIDPLDKIKQYVI